MNVNSIESSFIVRVFRLDLLGFNFLVFAPLKNPFCDSDIEMVDSSTGTDFTFSNDADFPNKVKLRKRVPVWFIELTLGIDHDRFRQTLLPSCVVKVTIHLLFFPILSFRTSSLRVCLLSTLDKSGWNIVKSVAFRLLDSWSSMLVSVTKTHSDLHASVKSDTLNSNKAKLGLNFTTTGATAVVSGEATTFNQKISLGKRVGLEVHES